MSKEAPQFRESTPSDPNVIANVDSLRAIELPIRETRELSLSQFVLIDGRFGVGIWRENRGTSKISVLWTRDEDVYIQSSENPQQIKYLNPFQESDSQSPFAVLNYSVTAAGEIYVGKDLHISNRRITRRGHLAGIETVIRATGEPIVIPKNFPIGTHPRDAFKILLDLPR